jgi:DNA-binding CsgD family transcriptional regulator
VGEAVSTDESSLPPIVEQIYDIVVEPDRLEKLCDVWVQHLEGVSAGSNLAFLGGPGLLPHVERVEAALRHMLSAGASDREPRASPAAWVNAIRSAAVIFAPSGEIVAANAAAQTTLGVDAGLTIEDLPVEAEDLTTLRTRLARAIGDGNGVSKGNGKKNGNHDTPAILRLRLKSKQVPVLIRMIDGAGGNPAHTGLVTTILSWPPELSALVQKAFGLTAAEADVLKDLALGYSVRDIAINSKRSEPTVRSHVSAVLAKTETSSQIELVRLTLGLIDGFQTKPIQPGAAATGDPTGNGNIYQTLVLTDGRRLDYLVIGDPQGAPFLMFPSDAGFTRLPVSAEVNLNAVCA